MSETKGESRVRVNFNVSGDSWIDQVKKKSAELIDLVDGIASTFTDASKSGELQRLKSLAMTDYESAAQWAVKALTLK